MIISPSGDVFQYLDTRSVRAHFTLQALLFENSFVVSLLGGTQIFQGRFLLIRSVRVTGQETQILTLVSSRISLAVC